MTYQQFMTSGWQRWQLTPTSTQTAPTAISATEPTGMIKTIGWRSIRIRVIGDTDADNAEVELYRVDLIGNIHASNLLYQSALFIDSNTWTVGDGTLKGVAGNNVLLDTEFLADTVDAPTITTWGQVLLNHVNATVGRFSPADNTFAELAISDLGNAHGIVPRFDTMTAGNYFSVLFELSL